MKLRIVNYEPCLPAGRLRIFTTIFLSLCVLTFTLCPAVSAAEWGGVDESVVEKYAEEYGRKARDPYINTDQGDLLLFVFLLAGAAGGFLGGYYWKELMEKRPQSAGLNKDKENGNIFRTL